MTTGILVTVLFMVVTAPAFAQPGDPTNPDVPLGGIEILLVSGGILGAKKLLSLRKAKGKIRTSSKNVTEDYGL